MFLKHNHESLPFTTEYVIQIVIDRNFWNTLTQEGVNQQWCWSYGSWIYNFLCNQCLSLLMLWVWISIRTSCTTLCDPVSSTNKTDRHDITEILFIQIVIDRNFWNTLTQEGVNQQSAKIYYFLFVCLFDDV
jgi:hypothetical protein